MRKTTALLVIVVVGAFLALGYKQQERELEFATRLQHTARTPAPESTSQDDTLSQLAPPPGSIAPVRAQARLSNYQGVEVHIEALQWSGRWFRPRQDHGISKIGGIQRFDLNKLIFDPDLPERGKPDLIATVGDVRFFDINEFLRESLGGYQLPKILGQKLSSQGPYETYVWNVRDAKGNVAKKVRMDLWLLEFSLSFQVQPAPDARLSTAFPRGTLHPVTGERISDLRPEYDNQRYGNLDVALKLVPRTDDWLVAKVDGGDLIPNRTPRIGIAAVETVAVKFEGDVEGKEMRIGAYIEKGQSLALHDRLDFGDGPADAPDRARYLSDVQSQTSPYYRVTDQQGETYLNPELFNREKYAMVHIANVGSWRRGNVFTGTRKWADQIQARFVIHAFVVGDWEIRRPEIVPDLDPRGQPVVETPSLVTRLLPDFGLGRFGRTLSGILIPLVGVLLLAVFFPPILTIVNTILGAIARGTQRLMGPRS